MILRKALQEEAAICYSFIEDGRAYHKSLGFEQWRPEYPTVKTIEEDISSGIGYVFAMEQGERDHIGSPIGYCNIILQDDPSFAAIDGAWKTERPYASVHRMAFSAESRGKGLAHDAFELIKAYCKEQGIDAIRVSTQEENKPMQRVFAREGFLYCGLIFFNGGPKLAYEWDRI